MTREEWVTEAKVAAGLAVQVVVDLARRNGCGLGFWETRLVVGTSLADDAETSIADGEKEPEHLAPRPKEAKRCPKCGSGQVRLAPLYVRPSCHCDECGHEWES